MSLYQRERLPFAPLLALAGPKVLEAGGNGKQGLANLLGVNHATVHRAVREDLTWSCADSWAVRLGYHPAEVWGDLWWELGAGDVCPGGHLYTEENTIWDPEGHRGCRTCHNAQHARKQRAVAARRRMEREDEDEVAA